MKRAWIALLLLGCEPSRQNQAEDFARGLQDIHEWHPAKQAMGFYAYDELFKLGDEAVPVLISHLTDDTPTKIMEMVHITVPTVGDVCFLMLCRIFQMHPSDFAKEGVVVLAEVSNPIFAVRFDAGARVRVQKRFKQIAD